MGRSKLVFKTTLNCGHLRHITVVKEHLFHSYESESLQGTVTHRPVARQLPVQEKASICVPVKGQTTHVHELWGDNTRSSIIFLYTLKSCKVLIIILCIDCKKALVLISW